MDFLFVFMWAWHFFIIKMSHKEAKFEKHSYKQSLVNNNYNKNDRNLQENGVFILLDIVLLLRKKIINWNKRNIRKYT